MNCYLIIFLTAPPQNFYSSQATCFGLLWKHVAFCVVNFAWNGLSPSVYLNPNLTYSLNLAWVLRLLRAFSILSTPNTLSFFEILKIYLHNLEFTIILMSFICYFSYMLILSSYLREDRHPLRAGIIADVSRSHKIYLGNFLIMKCCWIWCALKFTWV